jgi:hypothetical protein
VILLECPERASSRGGSDAIRHRFLQGRFIGRNPAPVALNNQVAAALQRVESHVPLDVLSEILDRVRTLQGGSPGSTHTARDQGNSDCRPAVGRLRVLTVKRSDAYGLARHQRRIEELLDVATPGAPPATCAKAEGMCLAAAILGVESEDRVGLATD